MGTVKVDLSGFTELQNRINSLDEQKDRFFEESVKELAARLLRKVILRTPVGVRPSWVKPEILKEHWEGYQGGTLRRGWTAKTEAQANSNTPTAEQWVASAKVTKQGKDYYLVVQNPVHYASYIELGHSQRPGRFVPAIGKRLKRSWVKGQFMLKISEEELRTQQRAVLESKLERFLKEVWLNGK